MSSILTIIRQRRHRRDQTRSSAQQRSQRAVFGFGFTVSAGVVALVLAAALAYASLTRGLPPVEQLTVLLNPQDGQLLQPTRLYDRTGQHLIDTLSPSRFLFNRKAMRFLIINFSNINGNITEQAWF